MKDNFSAYTDVHWRAHASAQNYVALTGYLNTIECFTVKLNTLKC